MLAVLFHGITILLVVEDYWGVGGTAGWVFHHPKGGESATWCAKTERKKRGGGVGHDLCFIVPFCRTFNLRTDFYYFLCYNQSKTVHGF